MLIFYLVFPPERSLAKLVKSQKENFCLPTATAMSPVHGTVVPETQTTQVLETQAGDLQPPPPLPALDAPASTTARHEGESHAHASSRGSTQPALPAQNNEAAVNARSSTQVPPVVFLPEELALNTPTKRRATSSVWEFTKRLRPCTDYANGLAKDGCSHVCVLKNCDGSTCNTALTLSRAPGGAWQTTMALRHVEACHPDHKLAEAKVEYKEKAQAALFHQQLNHKPVSADAPPGKLSAYTLTPAQSALSAQACWYVYASLQVSKRSFEDPFFVDMMKAQVKAGKLATTHRQVHAPILKARHLKAFVRAEFEVFLLFFKHLLREKWDQVMGNPFAQILHDGGTLDNHKKYQALGLQFIDPLWRENFVVCFGLTQLSSSTTDDVASTIKSVLLARSGFQCDDLVGAGISDRAARSVQRILDLEEEVCGMHDGDKLGQSATGGLVRTKNKKAVNPFPAGVEVMSNARKMATHFSYGTRYDMLWQLGDALDLERTPHVRMKVDLNGTRVAAQHNLLYSELRLCHALPVYAMQNKKDIDWQASEENLTAMAEMEAVLDTTRITTCLCQYEQAFTGAFSALIKTTTMNALRAPELDVVDLEKVDANPHLIRKKVRANELSEVGAECRRRATLEGERRWCENKTEELNGAEVKLTKREMLATLLDLRTVGCAHLTSDVRENAYDVFINAYVDFGLRSNRYKKEREEKTAPAGTTTQVEEQHNKAKARVNDGMKVRRTSGTAYGTSEWSDDDEEEQDDEPDYDDESVLQERLTKEAHTCFKAWRKLRVDWRKECPELAKKKEEEEELDLVADLMPLNVGPLYAKLAKDERVRFGYIPQMAAATIGALNAESFCERVLRCAGHVLTEGNTLLGDEELEMLVVLRMNRNFMRFMREKYGDVVKQPYGKTVVNEVQVIDLED